MSISPARPLHERSFLRFAHAASAEQPILIVERSLESGMVSDRLHHPETAKSSNLNVWTQPFAAGQDNGGATPRLA